MAKRLLGMTVYDAAKERIAWSFDMFEKLYVSFSGGKDSTVMLHMVMDEAIKRNRKVGVLFVDLEGQYKITINHIHNSLDMYIDYIDLYWVCLPLNMRNAVSVYEPQWVCWEPGREIDWVRTPPPIAITDQSYFPFYKYSMEFEDFVPAFGQWYSEKKSCGCFVGIRTDESLNRWRTISSTKKQMMDNKQWTTWCGETLFNIYPIYDWKVEDIWIYHGQTEKPHNQLYDYMHQAGLTLSQMRICQPYGDDQRRGLWLFHLIEPETWAKIVARVNGANSGALYVRETGNITGYNKITKPKGHTWKSFAKMLVDSMPPKTQEHYKNKIAVFLKWWEDRGFPNGIPDESNLADESSKKVPSWRRVCKSLLRNDYWCKGLSFSQHKSGKYENYLNIMKRRKTQWGKKYWI